MSKINFAMFMAGLTIGSAATWLCLKKRYEQIAQEEIDSVKAVFAEKKPETVIRKEENENIDKDNKIKADQAKLKPDLINYAAKLAEEGYTNYASTNNKNAKEEKVNMVEKPYIILPEEFGDFDEYTKLSLTYYSGFWRMKTTRLSTILMRPWALILQIISASMRTILCLSATTG